jgi:hypothetical protein
VSAKKTIPAYVVQRVQWEYNDEWYDRVEGGDGAVRTYLDRARAEAECRRMDFDHLRKEGISPIHYAGWGHDAWTSLPLPELVRRLRAAGFNPTPEQVRDALRMSGMKPSGRRDDPEEYATWLYNTVRFEALPEAQQSAVWEAFDRVRFFEVVEVPVELEE